MRFRIPWLNLLINFFLFGRIVSSEVAQLL
jgi:hypothetical protein